MFDFTHLFETLDFPVLTLHSPILAHVRVRSYEIYNDQIGELAIVSFDIYSTSMRMVQTSVRLVEERERNETVEQFNSEVTETIISGGHLLEIAELQGDMRRVKPIKNPLQQEPNWDDEIECSLRFANAKYRTRVQVSNIAIMECDFEWGSWSQDLQIDLPWSTG